MCLRPRNPRHTSKPLLPSCITICSLGSVCRGRYFAYEKHGVWRAHHPDPFPVGEGKRKKERPDNRCLFYLSIIQSLLPGHISIHRKGVVRHWGDCPLDRYL